MIVAKEIIEVSPYFVICKFNNGEVRKLDVNKVFAERQNDAYAKKILNPSIFKSVKIGEFGQLYWENMAQIKDLNGQLIQCEYDMSPEFIYHNSTHIR